MLSKSNELDLRVPRHRTVARPSRVSKLFSFQMISTLVIIFLALSCLMPTGDQDPSRIWVDIGCGGRTTGVLCDV